MDITKCELCPRKCGIDRTKGEVGFCSAGEDSFIGLYSLHKWEEPCISGENGSGTVFFSHCTMKCIFCQNYTISSQHHGKKISVDELSEIFLKLQYKGAHNINLVTPTHFLANIIPALDRAKANGLNIPILYNTSGYENVETLKELEGYIDIYMPDFKFWRSKFSKDYSSAPDYPEIVKSAICEMFRQTGKNQFKNGLMTKGVLVRHLLLPGHLYDAKKIIDYLYTTYNDDIYISLMSQYTPLPQVTHIDNLNRTVGKNEYDALCDYAAKIGIKNAFVQEGSAASESFIPEFYNEKE
ncbi:MAG: radical SAM protein [Eubacteriales bacterium]|nr:radical SAM protein [Eubacteriales bacterium]